MGAGKVVDAMSAAVVDTGGAAPVAGWLGASSRPRPCPRAPAGCCPGRRRWRRRRCRGHRPEIGGWARAPGPWRAQPGGRDGRRIRR
eukprot:9495182-Pyramimonas_sp.AAC.1